MGQQRSRRGAGVELGVTGLVIQLLTTEWSKDGRGGAGGRARQAKPLGMMLPCELREANEATLRLHHVYFSERRGFEPREWMDAGQGRHSVDVEAYRVERTQEGVRVLLDHTRRGLPGVRAWDAGITRGQHLEELLQVGDGEWGRAVYTERLQYWDSGEWGYCRHVLNVGLLCRAPLDVFRASVPRVQVLRKFLPPQRGPSPSAGDFASLG